MNTALTPMLAREPKVKPPRLPDGDDWIIERKLDGWRFMFHVTADGVRSYAGRNGSDRTGQAPKVEAALAYLPADTILDAELTVPGGTAPDVARHLAHNGTLVAVVFDVLRVAGTDVTDRPWSERRALLEAAAKGFDSDHVQISEVCANDPATHEAWLAEGYEGSVAKRITGLYFNGRRSHDWIKVKPQTTDEATITGFKAGTNGRTGEVGAFEIQMLRTGATTFCATSTDAQRRDVTAHPEHYLGKVIEVRHHGFGATGKPRHPIFARLRPDRDAEPQSSVAPGRDAATPIMEPVAPRQARETTNRRSGAGGLDLPSGARQRPTDAPDSPIRSATGRIRNLKAMGDAKLGDLVAEMQAYRATDPEGYAAIVHETKRRTEAL